MRQRLRQVVVMLSAIAFVGLGVSWARARGHADMALVTVPGGWAQVLASWRGRVLVVLSSVRIDNRPYGGVEGATGPAEDFDWVYEWLERNAKPWHGRWGFGYGMVAGQPIVPGRMVVVGAPHWVWMIPLALPPTVAGRRRWVLWQRRRRGLCLTCGYDLRASQGRCPECGRVFSRNQVG